MLTLYDYYRSTACYRVRIALALKNLDWNKHAIHLVEGEQHSPDYLACNPQGLVPALKLDSNDILTQSLAIIEYLDETWPTPPLLPENPLEKAQVRSLALTIACDMHPLNNLRVTQYLRRQCRLEENDITRWYHHWLKQGFDALELRLQPISTGGFCYGNQVSLADICLIPQVYNAHRFAFDLQSYPCIQSIYDHCLKLEAFFASSPSSSE